MINQPLLITAAMSFALGACVPDRDTEAVELRDRGLGRHLIHPAGEIPWEDAPPSLERGAQRG